jgi:hypothetical protein
VEESVLKTRDGLVHWHNMSNRFATYCALHGGFVAVGATHGDAGEVPTCLFCVDRGQRDNVYGLSAAMQFIIKQRRKP